MSKSITPLFRPAALAANQADRFGTIVLLRPPTLNVLVCLAACATTAIVIFFCLANYTQRTTVTGQLIPDSGIVGVYAQQAGVVLEKRVVEGQQVRRGDVLYVLSSDRMSGSVGGTQAAISSQVKARQASMKMELANTRALQEQERDLAEQNVAGLTAELTALDSQLEGQRQRVALSADSLRRYRGLLAKDYISKEQVQQKQEELLDQKIKLQALERERITVAGNLAARRSDLTGTPLKQQNQLAGIDRGILSAGEELTESEAKRRLVLVAPQSGIATAVLAEVGQEMDGSRPLVSIVPAGAKLQAHLYAPSHAVGFVKAGDQVRLRYEAFPYQKFGQYRGTVLSVARTARPASDLLASGLPLPGGAIGGEALYRIVVQLDSQTVNAYGRAQALQTGMALQADVMQESRRLFEWALEPLYGLTGKLR